MPSATDLASASRQRTLDCGGLKLEIKLALWEVTQYRFKLVAQGEHAECCISGQLRDNNQMSKREPDRAVSNV